MNSVIPVPALQLTPIESFSLTKKLTEKYVQLSNRSILREVMLRITFFVLAIFAVLAQASYHLFWAAGKGAVVLEASPFRLCFKVPRDIHISSPLIHLNQMMRALFAELITIPFLMLTDPIAAWRISQNDGISNAEIEYYKEKLIFLEGQKQGGVIQNEKNEPLDKHLNPQEEKIKKLEKEQQIFKINEKGDNKHIVRNLKERFEAVAGNGDDDKDPSPNTPRKLLRSASFHGAGSLKIKQKPVIAPPLPYRPEQNVVQNVAQGNENQPGNTTPKKNLSRANSFLESPKGGGAQNVVPTEEGKPRETLLEQIRKGGNLKKVTPQVIDMEEYQKETSAINRISKTPLFPDYCKFIKMMIEYCNEYINCVGVASIDYERIKIYKAKAKAVANKVIDTQTAERQLNFYIKLQDHINEIKQREALQEKAKAEINGTDPRLTQSLQEEKTGTGLINEIDPRLTQSLQEENSKAKLEAEAKAKEAEAAAKIEAEAKDKERVKREKLNALTLVDVEAIAASEENIEDTNKIIQEKAKGAFGITDFTSLLEKTKNLKSTIQTHKHFCASDKTDEFNLIAEINEALNDKYVQARDLKYSSKTNISHLNKALLDLSLIKVEEEAVKLMYKAKITDIIKKSNMDFGTFKGAVAAMKKDIEADRNYDIAKFNIYRSIINDMNQGKYKLA